MDDFNTPNLVLPMAVSFNERGQDGYNSSYTNNTDQLVINGFYEEQSNAIVGNRTIYLKKRPGLKVNPQASTFRIDFGDRALIEISPNPSADYGWWLFQSATDGSANPAVNDGSASVSLAALGYCVAWYDRTSISNTPTGVIQLRSENYTAFKTFYASVISSWTEISDSAFTAIQHRGKIEHMDGFAFQLGGDNKIYNSSLNSLQTWPAANFITKQIRQDIPVGLAKLNGKLLAFGEGTVEVFGNAGNPTGSPLLRIPELSNKIGLYTFNSIQFSNYYCELNGAIYFVGREAQATRAGGGTWGTLGNGFWSFNGQSFKKVSDKFIDKILSFEAITWVGTINFFGRTGIALQLLDAPTEWLMYFPDNNSWFRWEATKAHPRNNGRIFIGRASTATDLLKFQDDATGVPINMDGASASAGVVQLEVQMKLPKNSNKRESMAWAGVVADSISASASTTAHGNADLYISFSDNDYQSFSTPRRIDLTQRKKQVYRCGSYDDRAVRLVHSGNAECRIQAFIAKTL